MNRTLVVLALTLVALTGTPAQQKPGFAINPRWLTTYYYKSSWYESSWTLTLTEANGVLDGRIRSTGSLSDPRHLFNFRLVEADVLAGDWESDPVFTKKGKKSVGRGTFKATFYASSGSSFYIAFKAGPGNEIEQELAELTHSWYREPY